ncbi:MAG: hypothetical protein ACJZ8O_03155 [Pirellulaceae bacterium]
MTARTTVSTILALAMIITCSENVDAKNPKLLRNRTAAVNQVQQSAPAAVQAPSHQRPFQAPTPPVLFYNYYAPVQGGGMPAQIYTAPRAVPAAVGHVYSTYQPFLPHEFLYRHYRTYHHYFDGGRGMTRTRVIYW